MTPSTVTEVGVCFRRGSLPVPRDNPGMGRNGSRVSRWTKTVRMILSGFFAPSPSQNWSCVSPSRRIDILPPDRTWSQTYPRTGDPPESGVLRAGPGIPPTTGGLPVDLRPTTPGAVRRVGVRVSTPTTSVCSRLTKRRRGRVYERLVRQESLGRGTVLFLFVCKSDTEDVSKRVIYRRDSESFSSSNGNSVV